MGLVCRAFIINTFAIVFFHYVVIASAFADESTFDAESLGPDIQAEISRLEAKMWSNRLSSSETVRLGEIYFLTSRCNDVERLFKSKSAKADGGLLVCVCGGFCKNASQEGRLQQFKKLIEKGARWTAPGVQRAWRIVKDRPEAYYWAIKSLRQSGATLKIQHVRVDLEKSLESLEVNP